MIRCNTPVDSKPQPRIRESFGPGYAVSRPAGRRVAARRLRPRPAGATESGCTVHVAIPEVDAGPVLAQQTVPVLAGDDETTLHERIKAVERELYPATIATFLEHCASSAGNRVDPNGGQGEQGEQKGHTR